jgi:hypothetical protein
MTLSNKILGNQVKEKDLQRCEENEINVEEEMDGSFVRPFALDPQEMLHI